jgi:hypothetical protein
MKNAGFFFLVKTQLYCLANQLHVSAIIRPIPRIEKEINNTAAILVEGFGPYKCIIQII